MIAAWYLIESIPYDLLLASSTKANFLETERVELLCCSVGSVVFLETFSRGWSSCFLKQSFTSKGFCHEIQSDSFRIFEVL